MMYTIAATWQNNQKAAKTPILISQSSHTSIRHSIPKTHLKGYVHTNLVIVATYMRTPEMLWQVGGDFYETFTTHGQKNVFSLSVSSSCIIFWLISCHIVDVWVSASKCSVELTVPPKNRFQPYSPRWIVIKIPRITSCFGSIMNMMLKLNWTACLKLIFHFYVYQSPKPAQLLPRWRREPIHLLSDGG